MEKIFQLFWLNNRRQKNLQKSFFTKEFRGGAKRDLVLIFLDSQTAINCNFPPKTARERLFWRF